MNDEEDEISGHLKKKQQVEPPAETDVLSEVRVRLVVMLLALLLLLFLLHLLCDYVFWRDRLRVPDRKPVPQLHRLVWD